MSEKKILDTGKFFSVTLSRLKIINALIRRFDEKYDENNREYIYFYGASENLTKRSDERIFVVTPEGSRGPKVVYILYF